MIPNFITILRILFLPLIIVLLLLQKPYLAFGLFLLSALSDGLDGYLARRLGQITDLGKFLDPLADKLLVIGILVVLVAVQDLEPLPVIIIVGREVAVSILRSWKAKKGISMPASWLAKIKTFLQLTAIGMLILSLPYATLVLWFSVIVSIISGIEYAKRLT